MAKNGDEVRTTILLPKSLDYNLGIVAAQRQVSKSEIIRQGLIKMVEKENLDPNQIPTSWVPQYQEP